jgi:hypothetical protein
MSNFFNPGSPKFRRGVFLCSVYTCTFVSALMLNADYGTQEHVFSPIQRWINKKGDAFFNIRHEELYGPRKIDSAGATPIITMRRIDVDSNGNEIVKPPK